MEIKNGIPLIDISSFETGSQDQRNRIAAEVNFACEDIGFLVVTGHGVPEKTVRDLREAAIRFFALDVEEKKRVSKPAGADYKGYSEMGAKTVGRDRDPTLKPSLHESFAMGMPDVPADAYYGTAEAGVNFLPNRWPERPAELAPAMTEYYWAMRRLSSMLMRIFAAALKVPESYFAERLDKPISVLRVINYPSLDTNPQPGEVRSGEHVDSGMLTILNIDGAPGGLQVKLTSGEWVDVPYMGNSFVINIGDTMMRWTNGRYVSTLHRVVNPPIEALGRDTQRISIPYFSQPNYDAVIECIPSCIGDAGERKFEPITSGEILATKHQKGYSLDVR